MPTAVIYTRVSTSAQTDGASLESQIEACRVYALQHGYDVIREVSEVFSGAYLFDRPLLNDCRDEIRAGRYDAFIVYDIDRLSRSINHLGILFDECERYNTRLITVTSDFENTSEGKLLLSIRSYSAEIERAKIIERTNRGRRAKAHAGTLSYKRKLFGYTLDDDGKREIYEPEAEIVKRIFTDYLNDKSLREIAAALNTEQILTPKGKLWFARSVQVILNNPAYTGKTYAFREKRISKWVAGARKTQRVSTADDDRILLPDGTTPAIVSVEHFERVQIKLQINKKEKRRAVKREYLLRGLIRCRCGRLLSPHMSRGSRRYVCTSQQLTTTHCHTPTLNAHFAETTVWNAVLKLQKPKTLERIILKRVPKENVQEAALKKRIAQAEKELETLVTRIESVDDSLWSALKSRLEFKKSELDKLRKELTTRPPEKVVDIEQIKKALENVDLNNLSFAGKVEILKLFGTRILWNGETLDINFWEA